MVSYSIYLLCPFDCNLHRFPVEDNNLQRLDDRKIWPFPTEKQWSIHPYVRYFGPSSINPQAKATCVTLQGDHRQDQNKHPNATNQRTNATRLCLISLVHALFTLLTQSHPRNACPGLLGWWPPRNPFPSLTCSTLRCRSPHTRCSQVWRKIIN